MTDTLVGFELADGYEDGVEGVLTYGTNLGHFNVGAALRDNSKDGIFVTDDPSLAEALRGFPGVKEVPAPSDAEPVPAPYGTTVEENGPTTGAIGYVPQNGDVEAAVPAVDEQPVAEPAQGAEVEQEQPKVNEKIAVANAPAVHADDDDSDAAASVRE